MEERLREDAAAERCLWFIVVAAGSGSRFGADMPKQYCQLAGRPLLMWTIERLRQAAPQAGMTLVISADMQDLWDDLCRRHSFVSPPIVYGGATRWESVARGLCAVPAEADLIAVHDGARPMVDGPLVERLLAALDDAPDAAGVIPGVDVADSLRRRGEGGASTPVDRGGMVAVQTPQMFRAEALRDAYNLPYREAFTDDASVVEANGGNIALCRGDGRNIKVTRPEDILLAEVFLKQ